MSDLLPGEGDVGAVLSGAADWCVIEGDALALLRSMPDASIDAIVTDPPAGIGFMGAAWDHHKGGRDAWIAWLAEIMGEALRVLKPGGHALVWALPRTSHWTATACEDAGFEIRDRVSHVFGAGFPKSLDVGKAIDKAAGAEREVVGSKLSLPGYSLADTPGAGVAMSGNVDGSLRNPVSECAITAPATPEAATWDGWGTALKPAVEDWWLCRKPLARGLGVAANVLAHGTGAINVEGCRVGVGETVPGGGHSARGNGGCYGNGHSPIAAQPHDAGRWPPNLVHDGSAEVVGCFPTSEHRSGIASGPTRGKLGTGDVFYSCNGENMGDSAFYGDSGSAARFFPALGPDADDLAEAKRLIYCGKATRADRNEGLEGMAERVADPYSEHRGRRMDDKSRIDGKPAKRARNSHPTVKATALCRWFCRLITPPGGIVLDLFTGSGSTGKGAMLEGFRFIGSELNLDAEGNRLPYVDIARRRCADAWIKRESQPALPTFEGPRERARQTPLELGL